MFKKLFILTLLSGCCSPTYLKPAESYNTRHTVKCRNKTYAQCINEFASVKNKYEKQLDYIYDTPKGAKAE